MFSFFLSHIRTHLFRSISMICISSLCIIVSVILLFLYQNSSKALTYYNYNIIDERRFTLSMDTSYFDMFSRASVGLPSTLSKELESDANVSRVQSFSLVELPVLAEFSLFEFGLETDIPIFSVTDTALSWASIPVGMSRAMIDFYNMKVAGTTAMLPKIPEMLIRGQWVKLTFWASKIFPPLSRIAVPIEGKITNIDENFPWFGLTLPESIVREKMSEVGYELSPPYKIVAYMWDATMIPYIQKKYWKYNPKFDAQMILELNRQVDFMRNIFSAIAVIFSLVLSIFFVFLLFSFFRERRDVFRIIYIFWLSGIRARILTLAEPVSLMLTGILSGSLLSSLIIDYFVRHGNTELTNRGISYILFSVESMEIFSIGLLGFTIFTSIIIILEYSWRKKSLMR